MQNTFRKYMTDNYTHNELAEIALHGCESGCAAGMIYYSETAKLFDDHREDIFDILSDYQESMGADDYLPDYVRKNAGTFKTFANAAVWTAAEIVAYEMTQGEFIDEDETEEA